MPTGFLIFCVQRSEIGLGRALEIDERARRSTDSRGPEAEIDHLGSFREAKWPGRGPDPSRSIEEYRQEATCS